MADAVSQSTGYANVAVDGVQNLSVVDFTADASSATSVVDIRSPAGPGPVLRVTHDYRPSDATAHLYEIGVVVENISGAPVEGRYRRVLDWDVEPTYFNEFVTANVSNSTSVLLNNNDGFATANPLGVPDSGRIRERHQGNFVDRGPYDHGALFDFNLGWLAPGATKAFRLFYGAAPNEGEALNAVNSVAAEGYSLGQPNTPTGATEGKPNTFIFAFTELSEVGAGSEEQSNQASFTPSISGDGRYVAFSSDASNLVSGDNNSLADIFVRDRSSEITTRLSVSDANTQATGGGSFEPAISRDGRYVAFASLASNLVGGDNNGESDIFVRDRVAGTTRRVSVGLGGAEANGGSARPSISSDGRYISFYSSASNVVSGDTRGLADVFVRDTVNNTTTRVSIGVGGAEPDGSSDYSSISGDGRFVAFHSQASNLVAGDTNGRGDVFVWDLSAATTGRASVASSGAEADGTSDRPSISADGRYVAFQSLAGNLAGSVDRNGQSDIFVRDRTAGSTIWASRGDNPPDHGRSFDPSISGDGRFVAFASLSALWFADGNRVSDIYEFELGTGRTNRLSEGFQHDPADKASHTPALSEDGFYAASTTDATNMGSSRLEEYSPDLNGVADIAVHQFESATAAMPRGSQCCTGRASDPTKKLRAQKVSGPVHHLATIYKNRFRGNWGDKFEELFRNAGMTRQHALNKVTVPGHRGPHPVEYHAEVYRRLREAVDPHVPGTPGYTAALQEELRALARDVNTLGLGPSGKNLYDQVRRINC
ncbi:MAG: AHH domain-containing protein [Acidimicrobiales bacterium]